VGEKIMPKIKSQVATPGPKIAISDVPEVQEVQDLKLELDALKGEFPEVFMRLADLADRYNTAVERAEKIVRARGISCGPFINYSASMKYDAEKMYEELGEELFFETGGSVEHVATYKVDKDRVEAAVQSGKIPEESIEGFRTVARTYRKPSKLELP
jgi:hypothetical protein